MPPKPTRIALDTPRSPCPVACALDVVGDRWTLVVLRDLMLGRTQFKDFLASPEKISTNILSERLARLVAYGLVEKSPSTSHPGRSAYVLTERGRSLQPLLEAVRDWGLAHIEGTDARLGA